MTVSLVPMTEAHPAEVPAIYQAGIDEGNATFETSVPSRVDFPAAKLAEHRFVALEDDGAALGWVAVSPTSTRAAYAGVVEHSMYVHPKRPRTRHRSHIVGRADPLNRSRRHLDNPVRHPSREPRQPQTPSSRRLTHHWHPRTHRRTHGQRRDIILIERRSLKL